MSEEKKSSPVTPPSLFQFENIWRAVSVPLVAVLLALLIGALILILSGANPIQAYAALIKGCSHTDDIGFCPHTYIQFPTHRFRHRHISRHRGLVVVVEDHHRI